MKHYKIIEGSEVRGSDLKLPRAISIYRAALAHKQATVKSCRRKSDGSEVIIMELSRLEIPDEPEFPIHVKEDYTMQEFDERPVVEKMGFMDVLRVGYNYYFYKNRDMAGIPMHHRECVANDRIFQFLDLYMILRDQPKKVYYISGECRRKEQWYLILIDITNANSKTHKEIPSMWLPRRS